MWRRADAFDTDEDGQTRYSRTMDSKFQRALENLDREILQTETYLQELRLRRRGADEFLKYMAEQEAEIRDLLGVAPVTDDPKASTDQPAKPIDVVMQVFHANEGKTLTIDGVLNQAGSDGPDRTQVRNAIHYAVRKGWIEKTKGRGQWIYPGNASAPAVTGAEGKREPANGSREEEGEPDGAGSPEDGGAHPSGTGEHLHLSDRASIGG